MKTISKIEQEVNQIRLNIYEKTREMTPAQLTEYYRKSGEVTAKSYGFKIAANAGDKISQVFQENDSYS